MSNFFTPERDWSDGLSRRGFLKGAMLGGAGVLTYTPEAAAKALLQGKTAADINGAGIKPGIVDLDQNENPLGPSPMAIQAITRHLHELNRYMNDFPTEMYVKLNMLAGVSFAGIDFKTPTREMMQEAQRRNRVQITTGSTAVLRALTMGALEQGGHVIEAEGGYGDITRFAKALQQKGRDVTITRVPLTNGKRHDLIAMQKAVNSQTKLVVITNPNNPTGTIVSHEAIGEFINNVPGTAKILVDEAYVDFVKQPGFYSASSFAIEKENVIVSRTFSKVYGLPGVRMGYAIGDPGNFRDFWLYTGWMMPTLSVFAADAALSDTAHVLLSKETVWAARDYLTGELDKMGVPHTPSESNFMIVDVGKNPSELIDFMRKNKVLVRNAHQMWNIENHIRVTMGTMDEMEVFVSTFRKALAGI